MAKKDILVVTSLVGKGLEREYLLLRELLMANDYYVTARHYVDFSGVYAPADIVISFEVIHPPALNLSRNQWLVPNSEWWQGGNDQYLNRITKVLCKTQDCYRIWCQKVGAHKCVYIGFEARDIYRPEIEREDRFLHLAGESEFKNTAAVIAAWQIAPPHFPLTVVTRQPKFAELAEFNPFNNITLIHGRVPDEQVVQLMNSHRFHIMPSMYEGFGHALHEGIGCGAVVLTTDAAPMNAYAGVAKDFLVRTETFDTCSLARLNKVTPEAVDLACRSAAQFQSLHPLNIKQIQAQARAAFLAEREAFRERILKLVQSV